MAKSERKIPVGDGRVSAIWQAPDDAKAALVLAHGAGAGMRHRFMATVAAGLEERGIATLRYQFPYMEAGRKSPGSPQPAIDAVRAAAGEAAQLVPDLPLFVGGKSYGGRMSSTAESEAHIAGIQGLVFFGFPLHPPGKPSIERGAHLAKIKVPMLFLQGTRDSFADNDLIAEVCAGLGKRAQLSRFEDADHSFHVPKSAGMSDGEVMATMLDVVAGWIGKIAAAQ